MQTQTHSLLSNLRQFGLNPEDWTLHPQEEESGCRRYAVRSINDDSAPGLIGHAFQDSWVSLSVEEF